MSSETSIRRARGLEAVLVVLIICLLLVLVYINWDYYSGGSPFEHFRERLHFIYGRSP